MVYILYDPGHSYLMRWNGETLIIQMLTENISECLTYFIILLILNVRYRMNISDYFKNRYLLTENNIDGLIISNKVSTN